MKIYILFILIVFCSLSSIAKTNVALVADNSDSEKLADLILADLSNSDFVFLERNQVQQVLREQKLTTAKLTSDNVCKLGKLNSVDLFAIIRKDDTSSNYLLVVFDMASGMRLGYRQLSGDISQTSAKVKQCLKKALIIKNSSKILPAIIIAHISDAGTPPQFSKQLKIFVKKLELSISDIPNLIVLERNSLKQVTRERHITKRLYSLVASSYYLRLEFTPGKEFNIINATLNVTNVTKKILFKVEMKDIFSNSQKTINLTLAKINQFIKKNMLAKKNRTKSEAKMLYKDSYKTHPSMRRAKLEAAIALDYNNFIYQNALLRHLGQENGIEKNLNNLLYYWGKYNNFKTDFPSYYNGNPKVPTSILRKLCNKKLNSTQLKKIKEILPEIRTEYIRLSKIRFAKHKYHYPWAPVAFYPIQCLYFDDKVYITEKYKYWIKAANASRNYSPPKNPQNAFRMQISNRRIPEQIFISYSQLLFLDSKNNPNSQKKLFLQFGKFIKVAKNHPMEQIRAVSETFKLIIELQKKSPQQAEETMKKFFYAMKKNYPKYNTIYYIPRFIKKDNFSYHTLINKVQKEYQLSLL
jgi:curli production assembly/transport component CsgG